MAVDEDVNAYSTTAASNTPAGTDTVGPDLDDHLRDIKKNIRATAGLNQGTTAPTGFRGRMFLDTSLTASNEIVLKLHDGTVYQELGTIDTQNNKFRTYGYTLIATASASATSELAFASHITSAYDLHLLDYGNIYSTVDNDAMQFHIWEAGAKVNGTGSYRFANFSYNSTPASGAVGDSSATAVEVISTELSNVFGESHAGQIFISSGATANQRTTVNWQNGGHSDTDLAVGGVGTAHRRTVTAATGCSLSARGGSITGFVRLYGLRK